MGVVISQPPARYPTGTSTRMLSMLPGFNQTTGARSMGLCVLPHCSRSRVQPEVDPVLPAAGADAFVERSGRRVVGGGRPGQAARAPRAAFVVTGPDERFAGP